MPVIWKSCLAQAVIDKKISQKTADDFAQHMEDAEKEAAQMGKAGVDAQTFATSEAARRMMAKVGAKKDQVAADILGYDRNIQDALNHTDGKFRGLEAILGQNVKGGGVKDSLGARQIAVRKMFNAQLTDFLDKIRSKNFGLTRDRSHVRDMMIESFGRDSGSASAKASWQAVQKLDEYFVQAMAGEKVKIAAIEDHSRPQDFNSLKVKVGGEQQFLADYLDQIRQGGVVIHDWRSTARNDHLDPNIPEDLARITEILVGSEKKAGAFWNITTHGNASLEPGMPISRTVGDRYASRRVLEYTTPEAYFHFQDKWGNGSDNLSEAMMRHLNNKARDLAAVQVLGHDPDRRAKTLIEWGKSGKDGITEAQANLLQREYDTASGKTQIAANVSVANTMQGLRNALSSFQLGGAMLGSLPDFAFTHSTAAWNGLDFTKVMSNYLGGMNRKDAQRLLFINESGLRGLRDHFGDEATANAGKPGAGRMTLGQRWEAASGGFARVTGQMAEFTMRATGLEFHSSQLRGAYGMTQLGHLAEHADKPFHGSEAALPPVPDGMVRMYHGGENATSGGERHVTPNRDYATNWREGGQVWYVDVPENSPWLVDSVDVSGTNMPRVLGNSIAPEDVAAGFKRVPEGKSEGLPEKTRAFLERYGIDSDAWDTLRTKAMGETGLFMDPANLAFHGAAADRLPALRLLGAIEEESRRAVPEGGIATNARLRGSAAPGTFPGEVVRLFQYKGFGMSAGLMHGWRALDNLFAKDGTMLRGQYMAALIVEATVLGAASYQLKNVANGKDPERMDTAEFWGKAFALGGAGGMMSNWLQTIMQTQSMDDASRLAPPVVGLGLNVAALTGGNIAQAIHGDKTNAGREAANFARRYTLPRLWYTSLGMDRLVWDTLQKMVDPDAIGAFHRIEQRLRKQTGTELWWRPTGNIQGPERAPDVTASEGRFR